MRISLIPRSSLQETFNIIREAILKNDPKATELQSQGYRWFQNTPNGNLEARLRELRKDNPTYDFQTADAYAAFLHKMDDFVSIWGKNQS